MSNTATGQAATTMTNAVGAGARSGDPETEALLETLAERRRFLRFTVRELTEQQATSRPTVSALTLAGLVKHVAQMEESWLRFVIEGPDVLALPEGWQNDPGFWADGWRLLEGETLDGMLGRYEQVATRTEEIVRGLPDLGVSHPLPSAPWFTPGSSWSARRVLLHLISETAQHSGHADIIRESIDGQRTMG